MALDASLSIEATNSLEKMLAHQLAAVHKLAMEQMGLVSHERDAPAETNLVNAPPCHRYV